MRAGLLPAVLLAALAAGGCVAAAIPAVAPAIGAGGNAANSAGVFGGATSRTFAVRLPELYRATRQTLTRLGFGDPDEEFVQERVRLEVLGIDRAVRIELRPITEALTQMRVSVRTGMLGKDAATAAELVAQTEMMLARSPAALPRAR